MMTQEVFRELKDVTALLSCENLDEMRTWYKEDRNVLDKRQTGEYVALRADLKLDEVQVV